MNLIKNWGLSYKRSDLTTISGINLLKEISMAELFTCPRA
jgi:hypothetical protein